MQPIQPAGAGVGQPVNADRMAPTRSTRQSEVSSQVSMSSSSSTTTITINQQVEAFLSAIDPALANNQYLKLLIAALILQFLLGDDSAMQQTGQGGLKALEPLSGNALGGMYLSIESSTNTVQIKQQAARLDVVGAVQTLSDADGTDPQPGKQMDISG